MAKILFKFPTRGRPKIFKEVLDMYYRKLSDKHEYQFNITMDYDDDSMNNQDIWNFLDAKKNLKYCYGFSKSKVQAVNANMENETFNWDILVLLSDDMTPLIPEYDNIIVNDMNTHFSDFSGALHYNDGRVGSALCTLSIMGKSYYDRFGYIYHPDYTSLWCDNEHTEIANKLGKMKYIDRVIIKHGWQDITGNDHLHAKNDKYYEIDRAVFEKRKAAGFPKNSVL